MPNARLLTASICALILVTACAHKDRAMMRPIVTPSAVVGPAPPPPLAEATDTRDVVVTGSSRSDGYASATSPSATRGRAETGATSEPPLPLGIVARDPRQQPQSGLLTAADHDDLLNPRLYTRYAAKYLQTHRQPLLPLLDAADRIRIRVTDKAGHPAPFVRIEIARAGAAPLSLTTAADGAISIFPALDHLPDRLSLAITPPGGARFTRTARPTDHVIAIELVGAAPVVRKFDLLLTIDTTGSMGDELDYLQTELRTILAAVKVANPQLDIRVGLLAYRDLGDAYVTRPIAFTRNIADLQGVLAAQQASGGGDYPEAVDRALAEAGKFDWRTDAVKAMLFVADAPPHDERMGASWAATMALRDRGIHIVPVGASGVAEDAEYLMRSMAAVTQSRYIFLTDDSGVGLPHEDPDVPCYLVTRLNGLVGRVLAGLISGTRVEPRADDVIREVGDYDHGVCLAYRRPQPGPLVRER